NQVRQDEAEEARVQGGRVFDRPSRARRVTMLRDGIDEYHELLTDGLAAESQGQLDAQLRERGLFFGERPLCSVLRPRFLSPTQYRFLQQRAAVVLRALRKAHRAALVDDALLAQFRLSDWERDLAHVDPGFRDASPVSRLDAFF